VCFKAELNDGRSMIISFQDETVTELTTVLIDLGARDALESTSLVPTITDGKPDLLGGLIVLVVYTLLFAVFLQSLSQFLRG